MELVGLFLLVLMPPADATGETAEALTVSIHAELGDVTMVLAPDTLVTPAMWQGENASMRARFVAHVIWKDKNNITVDVVSNGDAGSRAQFHESRSLAFAAEDSKTERGRAMALVLAELLRESPAAALIVAHPPGAVEASASRLALAGLFADERVRTGAWAMGPEVRIALSVNDAFWVNASGRAQFASADQYQGFGAGLAAVWRLLRSQSNRHWVGVGLGIDVLHESAMLLPYKGEGAPSVAQSGWDVALVPSLSGSATIWRRLRFFASANAGFLSTPLSTTQPVNADTEHNKPAYTRSNVYPRFRPGFALGLELAL
jgi:hypothetical protein